MKFEEYVKTIKHCEISENSLKRLMDAVDAGDIPTLDSDTVNEPVEVIGKQPIYRRPSFAAGIAASVILASSVTVIARMNTANEPLSDNAVSSENENTDLFNSIDCRISEVTPRSIHITVTDFYEPHMIYGRAYTIERLSGEEWLPVEPVIDNYGFPSDAKIPDEKGEITFDINWEWLYGVLPEGEYRIDLTAGYNDPNVTENGYREETLPVKFRISFEDIFEDYREKINAFNEENGTSFQLLTEDNAAEYGVDMGEYRAFFADRFSAMTDGEFGEYLEHLKFLRTDDSVRERLDKVNLAIEEEPVPDQPKTYDVNGNGMTYGYSLDSVAFLPDLSAAVGDHEIFGYVYSYELLNNNVETPEDAAKYMESVKNGTYKPRVLTVFDSEGELILDVLTEDTD